MWPLEDPFGGKGELILNTPTKRQWLYVEESGLGHVATQEFVDPLFEQNKQDYNESYGKKWGDGQIIGSVPASLWFKKLLPAEQQGDEKYIKRFWNDSDNRAFRRFKGTV